MNSLSLAVVSDLHCHPKDETSSESYFFSDGIRIPTAEHPIEALKELIKREDLNADALVLPGDFSNRANLHGYVVGVHAARDIAAALGCPLSVATLGNHDVDSRNIHGKGHDFLGRNLFPDFPAPNESARSRFFSSGYYILPTRSATFLVVNSVFQHTDPESAEHGAVTNEQLSAIKASLKDIDNSLPFVCVSHHHPLAHELLDLGDEDLMRGGDKLLELLEQHSCDLFVHGHKHHPRLRYSTGGSIRFPIFASGSVSAILRGKLALSCKNTFHLIRVEKESKGTKGTILSWELSSQSGWVKAVSQSAGINHKCGFGFTGHLRALAQDIVTNIGSSDTLGWAELEHKIPALRLLIPQELERLCMELRASGFIIEPEPRSPIIIGRAI